MKIARAASLLFLFAFPAAVHAQSWSVSVGSGPFVFGDFAKRTFRVETGEETAEQTTTLSAGTRAGLSVGLERELGERWAIRATGTFTRAPLKVGSGSGVELENGDVDVATIAIPIVFRINTNGAFRFYVYGGPAHAAYRITGAQANPNVPLFEGTRTDWGLTGGGGVSWRVSDRFSIDGEIDDTVTESPFHRDDLLGRATTVEIPRTHNVHTTIAGRWRF